MLNCKRLFSSLCLLAIGTFFVCAQNNSNSPYTRFGYGKIADRSCDQSLSMGGVGYGLRTYGQINPLNPASYSEVDSLTFLFNFGLTAGMFWMSDDSQTWKDYSGNISYLTMQFRLMKNLGMSLGVRPFSYVGYNYGNSCTIGDTYYVLNYQGTGSLMQVYGGLGYEIIKDRLSVGANFGYTFGSINRDKYLTFPESAATSVGSQSKAYSVTESAKISAHDVFWETGIQYTQPVGKKNQLTLGVVFSPKQLFESNNSVVKTTYDTKTSSSGSSSGVVISDKDSIFGKKLYMPMNIGAGVGFVKNNRLTLGADVLYQAWADVPFPEDNYEFKDKMRYAVGAEFVPNPFIQRGFLKRMRYRAGLYYTDSYVKTENAGINEFGATVGVGMPFRVRGRESMLNIGAEYSKVVPEKSNLINEQYFKLTFGITFCETWFHKRKFE